MLNRFIFPVVVVLGFGFLYYFSSVTMPFLIAGGIAYVFQPVVGYLERINFPRWLGALCVTLAVFAIVVVFFVYTAPILYEQLTKLIKQVPGYISNLQTVIQQMMIVLNDQVPAEYSLQVQEGIQSISKDLVSWLLGKTHSAFEGGLTIIHYVTLILIVPVLTFYLMKDWQKLLDTVRHYIPPQNKKVFIQQAQKIDQTLASFARGQALVCLILIVYYSLALHILGLDFGGLIGSLTGLFAFIPYVGAILGFATSGAIAFLQTSSWMFGESGSFALFGAVTIVFAFGQFLEGVILSPNIVGKSIKLHPLWIMFSLFFGGYLFGFAGILVATPVAGAIGVVVRYAFQQYRNKMHSLYHEQAKQRRSYGPKS
ncbi:MAG: AI-2E family transporter [Alphaproteobacteria bacterium]|nr:AI-2E family transporter [Alphaproteobacteria bacterium]